MYFDKKIYKTFICDLKNYLSLYDIIKIITTMEGIMKEYDRFLTITPIHMILQYDTPVEHSDLARKLIDEVKSKLGIEIVCCYAQITRLLSFEDEETIQNSNKFIKKYRNSIPPHFFTDRTAMSLCVRGSLSQVKALDKDESVKKAVAQIYSDLLKTERISIEYKRAYSQLELKYYGYLNANCNSKLQ